MRFTQGVSTTRRNTSAAQMTASMMMSDDFKKSSSNRRIVSGVSCAGVCGRICRFRSHVSTSRAFPENPHRKTNSKKRKVLSYQIAQRVDDRSMHDVQRETDFAQVLQRRGAEDAVAQGRQVARGPDDHEGADGRPEAVLLGEVRGYEGRQGLVARGRVACGVRVGEEEERNDECRSVEDLAEVC